MRKISRKRQLVEHEGIVHSVIRGWRKRLHFENMPRIQRSFGRFLDIMHLRNIGRANALKVHVNTIDMPIADLGQGFDGFRILFISDLHIDDTGELTDKVIDLVGGLEFDICLLGGDYSFGYGWLSQIDHSNLGRLIDVLTKKGRVAGVLGNHDVYSVAEFLDQRGVEMLINDNLTIERSGQYLSVAGIDDCHYFGSDDMELASEGVPDSACKVMLSHSPERLFQAERLGYDLYLAGHTHAGQVCLPGGLQIVKGASLRRKYLKGAWQYKNMQGYTSKGAGTSGTDVRFFCRPEITVIRLKKQSV